MNVLVKILVAGLVISFLGSLPLGTMNVVATQISVSAGKYPAVLFCTGAVLIEVLYVRLALTAMDKIVTYPAVFRFFEWLAVVMLLVLAIGCFITAGQSAGVAQVLPVSPVDTFWLGVLLSATSPLHITFWFGWSTVLIDKGILIPQKTNYRAYITGIGLGSILGYLVFIVGGNYLISMLRGNQQLVNWIIGTILLVTALIQAFKTIRKYQATTIQHDS